MQGSQLVHDSLVAMLQLQIAGTQRHRLGDALGDEASLQSAQLSQRNGSAIVSVESFSLDNARALNGVTRFISMLGGVGTGTFTVIVNPLS